MAGTVVAVFFEREAAHNASRALLEAGVSLNDISVVAKARDQTADLASGDLHADGAVLVTSVREVEQHDVEQSVSQESGMAGRAAAGAAVGVPFGLFLASTLILIPGIGPVVAAGPVAAMLAGGAVGGVAGAFVGSLASEGIPEAAATTYHDHVHLGHALVAVISSSEQSNRIEKILLDHGGRNIGFYPRILDSVQSIES